jgi:regulator of sigma E protease
MDIVNIILVAIFIISFLVLTHELGHFITAKRAGVRIQEFGLGYPPRLFSIRRGETDYSINLLPLGGFVKMLGEEDPSHPDSLAAKSPGARLVVMASGSVVHLLVALIIFSAGFMIPREIFTGEVQVQEVAVNSPAEAAGIMSGDVIVEINGKPIDTLGAVHRQISANLGQETSFLLRRNEGDTQLVRVVPRTNPPEGEGAVGVSLSYLNPETSTVAYPVWEAVPLAIDESFYILDLTKDALLGIIFRGDISQVAGPVGIVQMTGEFARSGFVPLMEWVGILALSLGIFNILPIPMLDGGRIVFVLIEIVRGGRRVSPEREAMIHLIGLVLLLSFIVVVSYNDIMRIISGINILQ